MASPSTDLISSPKSSDTAYQQLKSMIVDLTLTPGTFLNEQTLVAMIGMGRTPVREALASLARDRFITILSRRGVVIEPITFENVLDMFEARETFECGIAYIAALRVTDSDLETMRLLVAKADAARLRNNAEEFLMADYAVHAFLTSLIRNPILQEAADRLLLHNLRFWRLYWRDRPVQVESMLSHANLISAFESRDPLKAEEAMREHLESSRQLVQLLFER
ncbi:MAG TPA: GntR family transcriptional regulator [Acidimicrobiales bacterium]|jgi:DNA-binding GntR family transcriptional regulator|nr:GntR family transcriptional regulator [Acidimicrobiales bacterium]